MPVPELPLVSILTPSYNQGRFIEETIRSVLTQDYPNLEYLIVDGGSTDGSLEVIQRYANQLAWWGSEKDRGQTEAINKGFSHARGEIFAWLNSDDTYLHGAVARAVAYLQAHPEAPLVYADANLIDEQGQVIGQFPSHQTDLARLLRGSVHIPQQTTFFRASAWKQVAPLDESFHFAMDYDLWVRLSKLGPLIYTPGLWANFRLHGGGKSLTIDDRCYPEMIRVYQRECGRRPSLLQARWLARRTLYAWLPLRLRVKLRKILTF
ncbi:MAG: glycosyltransferase [Anaerolineae bacterium]|nr:glycosyltransferase [Anaerolineae bacterium]